MQRSLQLTLSRGLPSSKVCQGLFKPSKSDTDNDQGEHYVRVLTDMDSYAFLCAESQVLYKVPGSSYSYYNITT